MTHNSGLNSFNVLITRPKIQGEKLAQHLQSLSLKNLTIYPHCYPLLSYQISDNHKQFQPLISPNKIQEDSFRFKPNLPIVIFVSAAAVEYAQKIIPASQWKYSQVLCVGSATQDALNKLKIAAKCPDIQDSDGLLNLPELHNVIDKHIIIVRGDGGRELLAQGLIKRGAQITYIESYKRIWHPLDIKQIDTWYAQKINCIVVTSNALLESVVHLLKDTDNHWKNICLWIVASQRIAKNAQALGLSNVINANGASDQAISRAILSYSQSTE